MIKVYWLMFKEFFLNLGKPPDTPIEKEDISKLTQLQLCSHNYRRITPVTYLSLTRTGCKGHNVSILLPTIEHYFNEVNRQIKSLEDKGYYDPSGIEYSPATIRINDFLLTADRSYIENMSEVLSVFAQQVVVLCELLETASHPDHNTRAYSQRVATPLLISLNDISATLDELV